MEQGIAWAVGLAGDGHEMNTDRRRFCTRSTGYTWVSPKRSGILKKTSSLFYEREAWQSVLRYLATCHRCCRKKK